MSVRFDLHEQGWTQRAIAEELSIAQDTAGNVIRERKSHSDFTVQTTEPDTTAIELALEEENKAAAHYTDI